MMVISTMVLYMNTKFKVILLSDLVPIGPLDFWFGNGIGSRGTGIRTRALQDTQLFVASPFVLHFIQFVCVYFVYYVSLQ